MRRIVFILSAVVLILVVVLWGKMYRNEDVIPELFVVGTTANFWPFTFRTGSEIAGFDIDVAREVVKRLGKKMVIRDVPFNTLIPQLELGAIDLVAAGMAITPERAERVAFSTSYIDKNPLVVISDKPIGSINDLRSKKNIYASQGNAYTYLKKIDPQLPIKVIEHETAFNTTTDVLDIVIDPHDALVTELLNIHPMFIKNMHIYPLPHTMERTALAVSKNAPLRIQRINKILHDMETDGTLQSIRTKWDLN